MPDTSEFTNKDNTKLIISLGFGAVLVIMFMLVFIALEQLHALNQNMTELVEETNAKTAAAHTMRDVVHLRANALTNMQLLNDPFERDEEFMRLGVYGYMYRTAREELVAKGMNSREKDIHERLSEATRLAQPLNENAAQLLLDEAPEEQIKEAMQKAAESRDALLILLDELVALEKQSAEQALSTSKDYYLKTRVVMLLLVGIALVAGIVIAILVIRRYADRNRQISYHANHDALTGLFNRREIELRLERAIYTSQQENVQHALLYIDLDRFKLINDTCGHMAGDEFLRQLTSILAGKLRQSDTLGRLGGDEFVVLLENCNPLLGERISEKLRETIEAFRFTWEGKAFSVSASIGIVPITNGQQSLAKLLSTADTACYMAKQDGRNRIHAATPDDQDIASRLGESANVVRIRAALDSNLFRLHGQIIAPASETGSDKRYIEILLRMVSENGMLIAPGAFIPCAERYNLMPAIDRWVIKHAVNWLTQQLHRKELPTLMINLSGQSLTDDKFLEFNLNLIRSTRVPAHNICFEITETAAVANLSKANKFIAAMKGLGCRFALDDFGSGFSSFSYLKQLPVDFLKIDGSFVKDIAEDPIDFAMVKSINEIGQVLGKKTIAEFVENRAILDKLEALGVDYVQGYGICKPQPLESLGGAIEVTGNSKCRRNDRLAPTSLRTETVDLG